jgi:hypothetical protein
VFSLKIVYCALVRSHLEYATCVWNPMYAQYISSVESVQNRFLKFTSYRLGAQVGNYNYLDISILLNLQTLETRRRHADLCFLYKLIAGTIDCSSLLFLLSFKVKQRNTRDDKTIFLLKKHSTNYLYNSPIHRMMRLGNDRGIDVFAVSLDRFKRSLKEGDQ